MEKREILKKLAECGGEGSFLSNKFRKEFAPLCADYDIKLDAPGYRIESVSDKECHALAAAMDYYSVDADDTDEAIDEAIDKAIETFGAGNYFHAPDCRTAAAFGEEYFYKVELTNLQCYVTEVSELLEDFFDFAAYGRFILKGKGGKFTRFGGFVPDTDA